MQFRKQSSAQASRHEASPSDDAKQKPDPYKAIVEQKNKEIVASLDPNRPLTEQISDILIARMRNMLVNFHDCMPSAG